MSSQIYLFSGPGCGPFCVQATVSAFNQLIDDRNQLIKEIKSIDQICWEAPIKALVVPGGAATKMVEDGIGRQIGSLKSSLKNHQVAYFGICAGGILAPSSYHGNALYKDKTERTISYDTSRDGSRLGLAGLIPHTVLAPLFPKQNRTSSTPLLNEFRLQPIYSLARQETVEAPFILGPGFLPQNTPNEEIIARFPSDLPNLVTSPHWFVQPDAKEEPLETPVECLVFQSDSSPPVMVSAAHLEITSDQVRSELFKGAFNASNKKQQKLADKLSDTDLIRLNMLKERLLRIGIECKPD